jgi:hypothetical protein
VRYLENDIQKKKMEEYILSNVQNKSCAQSELACVYTHKAKVFSRFYKMES